MPNFNINRHEMILKNMNRLAVLRNLALVDSDEEPFFDRMTDIASKVIDAPVSLVSMVTSNYQFFKSSSGLPEPLQSQRRTPLSHSFCQYVVSTGEPLIVEDARKSDLLKDNLAVRDFNVIGYLGMPLYTDDGQQLGSFCVLDTQPRHWTSGQIAIMKAFSKIVNAEIDARSAAYHEKRLQQHIEASRSHLDQLERDVFLAESTEKIIEVLNTFLDKIKLGR